MKKVVFIHKDIRLYRKTFLESVRLELKKHNIDFNIIYGKGEACDETTISWGLLIPHLKLLGSLIWQPYLHKIKDYDLVIVEQANKLLLNYLLMFKRLFDRKRKLAFWGHGYNKQKKLNSIFNHFKKMYCCNCDWWFAYTEGTKRHLINWGFCADKITVTQNAIDTKTLQEQYAAISTVQKQKVKNELGIGDCPVGIYCGGMYKEKRIDFLLKACKQIKKVIPNFQMIFIGFGSAAPAVQKAAAQHSWIHYLGKKTDFDKVLYFSISDILLMPGLVGLVILDSFAMQTPLATTDYPFHSPEIEYLEPNYNGIKTNNNLEDYSSAVINYLKDETLQKKLKENCFKSAHKYTNEQMVNNFCKGIISCLK